MKTGIIQWLTRIRISKNWEPFWGTYGKGYSILGSLLGFLFLETPCCLTSQWSYCLFGSWLTKYSTGAGLKIPVYCPNNEHGFCCGDEQERLPILSTHASKNLQRLLVYGTFSSSLMGFCKFEQLSKVFRRLQ